MKRFNQKEGDALTPDKKILLSSNPILEGLRNATNFLLTNVEVTFEGTENLNNVSGPFIFVIVPHNGHMDSPLIRRLIGRLGKGIKRKTLFLASRKYWQQSPQKYGLPYAVRAQLVDTAKETDQKQKEKDKETTIKLIRAGNHAVIFPEGTRAREQKTIRERTFKTGPAQIAIATRDLGTKLVPIYLEGAEEMMPPGANFPKFRKERGAPKFQVKMVVGVPIDVAQQVPNNFENLPKKRSYEILQQIMGELQGFFIAQEEFGQSENRPEQPY